jgi:Ca2+-transporting ATPase
MVSGWSALIATCVLGALGVGVLWLELDIATAVTISFLTLGFAKLGFVFNLREPGTTWRKNDVVRNPWIWGSIGVCVVLLILAVYLPGLSDVLKTQPLDGQGWIVVVAIGIIPMVVGQVILAVKSNRSTGEQRSEESE